MGNKERLGHMLDSIELIQKALTGRTKKDFEEDFILKAAIQSWIQIIGEAASKLTVEFRTSHSEVNWKGIIGLRHVIVHDYFELDEERVWNVIENDLPDLKVWLQRFVETRDV